MMKKLNFKNFKLKHYISYIAVSIVLIVCAVLSFTGNLKSSSVIILEKIALNIVLAVSLSLVVGFLGELSLGHAGFMCVGAYLGGKISVLLVERLGNGIFPLLVSILVGGLIAALFGFFIGLPALKLKGDYLAIVTLAFGEIVKVIFQQSKFFGGTLGLDTPRFDRKYFFLIAFVIVLFTLMVIQNLIRSKHGRAITAIRDNEIAARATGINVTKYKLMAFVISAFFAGIAGVMSSYTSYTVQASNFGYNYSIEILVMVVLGGMGSINGSIIAATVITLLNEKLSTLLTGDLAVIKQIVYAAVLIIIVIYNNAPALEGFRDKYNFKRLWEKIRKPKYDPSVVNDDAASWNKIPTKINMDEVLSVDIVPGDEYVPDKPDKPEKTEKGDKE